MNYLDYTQDVLYSYYENRISDFLKNGQKEAAQKEAFEWLREYEDALCITVPWNWKIAKKQIAAYFFGKNPSVQIHYDDNINLGIHFIKLHSDRNVRCSFHKFDTACHSESHRVDENTFSWLMEIKKSMFEKDIIDIFTECSTSKTVCFRRVSRQYNETVAYEMGYGQAMYVFEKERGKHDVAGMIYSKGEWEVNEALDVMLNRNLEQLIKNHEQYLATKTGCICYYLGIPQISIEGYFDVEYVNKKPIIVDIDLPFDRAFF